MTKEIKTAKNKIGTSANITQAQEGQFSPTTILQNMLKENGKKLKAVLGDNAGAFMVSVINLYNTDLIGVEPQTVLNSAFIAAALKLPIEKNLGFAYIYKYGNQAQFILGYKGMIQLALRSGGVRKINAIPIREGQIISFNPLTEEVNFNMTVTGGEVVGYAAYMELINGFNKTIYMSKDEIENHADKFSQTYKKDKDRKEWDKKSVWSKNFDEMAIKTVLKKILKFAPLSTEMQLMETIDQSSIKKADIDEATGSLIVESVEYVDNQQNMTKATKEEKEELLSNAHTISYDILKVAKEQGIDFNNATKDDLDTLQSVLDEETNKRM
ncbi:recombinase RecT [Cetobacterium sp. 2A]|uniref:recombinase RecT n=1 Tax=Cetobacterium sp. 2A TaxID=2754723 RepID=UPI00163C1A3B|nr:recombinase RecT [Cetobacterium sp. 2A]MBC2855450.1 recombinase RecT [Cetobacterium sp. 2A]